ncbi:MAG TPA: SRPBCC domain-containing protein [Thermomicrobiales bacterium]|nr:SRPBCC domain-containing protein [Thermomicrobiales bacterium]
MITNVTASTTEPLITMTRTFDAPRELVFEMWTKPEHIANWFGPEGFTVPRCEIDLRVGGAWHIDMQGPDGTVYPNKGVYQEIVPPEKIVYTDVVDDGEAWGDTPPPSSELTILFEEEGGKTTMTTITRLQSIAARDAMLEMGAAAGWDETLNKLAAYLATV